MKKFIALAIAVVMLAALAVPAFAATITDTGSAVVTYSIDEDYTVTIPDNHNFGATVAVSVVGNIEEAKTITVASANDWTLGECEYGLLDSEDAAIDTAEALLVSGIGAEVNSVVNFKTAWVGEGNLGPAAAGTYTDTLTFTVA